MRYIGLLLFFLCIPLAVSAIRSDPKVRRGAWVLLGAAPYIYGWAHLSVSIVSWAYWPGYVKGIIVALPDLVAIGLLLTAPRKRVRTPVLMTLCLYIAVVAASATVSELPFASEMYAWQLLRVLMVAAAVARVSASSDAPRHIVYGLCCGVLFQTYFCLVQRFGHGVVQANGTVGHQNLLGMMTHFALLTSTALILAGDRAKILKLGVTAALLTVALTGSRGTLGFAGAGVALLVTLSLLLRPTATKMRVAGAGVALVLVLAPVVYMTLAKRFSTSNAESSDSERAAFERAARMMWADHPMGVGANEYVVTANTKGYSARAGVIWNSSSRSANVHNAYLLIAAETGWAGIGAFLLLYLTAIATGLVGAWIKPFTRDRELLLGVAVTLATVALHNFYEWIFVVESTQYLFALMLGFTAGLGVPNAKRRHAIAASTPVTELVAS